MIIYKTAQTSENNFNYSNHHLTQISKALLFWVCSTTCAVLKHLQEQLRPILGKGDAIHGVVEGGVLEDSGPMAQAAGRGQNFGDVIHS